MGKPELVDTHLVVVDSNDVGSLTDEQAKAAMLSMVADGMPFVFVTAKPIISDKGEEVIAINTLSNLVNNDDLQRYLLNSALQQVDG